MDFGGTQPWLRELAFTGVFAAAAVLVWWNLTSASETGWRQLAMVAAALATIPAAVVASVTEGPALTALGVLAVVAFAACAGLALFEMRVTAAAPPTGAGAPDRAPSQTRVATPAMITETRSAPRPEHTVALSPGTETEEVAFLVDFSRDGHATRLGPDNRIGRDTGEIPIGDAAASREHARVKLESGAFVLYDLGSTNGTYLVRNGRRRKLQAPARLQDLDTIEVGAVKLVFIDVRLPPK